MTERKDLSFSDLMERLKKEARSAAWYIGYLKAIFDNDLVPQKCDDSFCGRALITAQDGVTRALALYCTRIWENKPGLASLPRARLMLPSTEELRARHAAEIPEESMRFWEEYWLDRIEAQRSEYLRQFESTSKSIVHDQLKALRNEAFAHNFARSRERGKLEISGVEVYPTGDALVDIATQSLTLLDMLSRLWNGVINNQNLEWIDYTERQCREFWRVLPVLKDVEGPA